MGWFYEILNSNRVVVEKVEGFASERAAAAAGKKRQE
jgi:hypothetical protein